LWRHGCGPGKFVDLALLAPHRRGRSYEEPEPRWQKHVVGSIDSIAILAGSAGLTSEVGQRGTKRDRRGRRVGSRGGGARLALVSAAFDGLTGRCPDPGQASW
jgi:hypothetical protein